MKTLRGGAWLLATALLLVSPYSSLACKCKAVTAQSALDMSDVVFRGTVLRQLTESDEFNDKFVVRVGRKFKGCNLAGDRVVIETGSNSANCGVALKVGLNYVFSSSGPTFVTPADGLGNQTKITQVWNVNTCNYNREWGLVPEEDKKVLRSYKEICGPIKCVTGKDCPSTHYCDVDYCKPYDGKCPEGVMMPICAGDPCLTAKPCTEATCYPSFCSRCFPIFVDANGTRVCIT
jgi:Tissue inhibitor of metalloproteinase